MELFLTLAYLFFIGSVLGWVLELVFRNLCHRSKKWINPGFCTGPYVPLYGFGLSILYLLASMEQQLPLPTPFWRTVAAIVIMGVAMTVLEYVAGILCLRIAKVRLWDYSGQWGNIQGIICPLFSLAWAVLGGVYDLFVHPHVESAMHALAQSRGFTFLVGLFFGVFLVDVGHSIQLTAKLKKFAEENAVILRYESIKAHIRAAQSNRALRFHFFTPFRSVHALSDHLRDMYTSPAKTSIPTKPWKRR